MWDVLERKRLMMLRGHEATVCSVVADETKIVSGAADKASRTHPRPFKTVEYFTWGQKEYVIVKARHTLLFYRPLFFTGDKRFPSRQKQRY